MTNTNEAITHKEATAHIRKRLRAAGINAKCSMYVACGVSCIKVSPVTFEARFSETEQREIALIAKVNHLTGAHGSEIDIDRGTYGAGATWEFHPRIVRRTKE